MANRWHWARGPVTGTILALQRIGWKAIAPALWRDAENQKWSLADGCLNLEELNDALKRDTERWLWKEAANHFNGSGLEEGADLVQARRHYNRLKKRGQHSLAGILLSVLSGGYWTNERKAAAFKGLSPLCPRCQKEPESALHRFWTCPCNADIPWEHDPKPLRQQPEHNSRGKDGPTAIASRQEGKEAEQGNNGSESSMRDPQQLMQDGRVVANSSGSGQAVEVGFAVDVSLVQGSNPVPAQLPQSNFDNPVLVDGPGFDDPEADDWNCFQGEPDMEQEPWLQPPDENEEMQGVEEQQQDHDQRDSLAAPDDHSAERPVNRRCNRKPRTPQHPIRASEHLAERATADVLAQTNCAKWLRAMQPSSGTKVQLPQQERTVLVADQSYIMQAGGHKIIYLDGSGSSSDRRTCRCGWGISWLNSDNSFLGGQYGNLGDEMHTLPKSELEALRRALRVVNWRSGSMQVWSDNDTNGCT